MTKFVSDVNVMILGFAAGLLTDLWAVHVALVYCAPVLFPGWTPVPGTALGVVLSAYVLQVVVTFTRISTTEVKAILKMPSSERLTYDWGVRVHAAVRVGMFHVTAMLFL